MEDIRRILVSFENKKFEIYKITTPSLDPDIVLYPIGAGDSVAAGTLASWTSSRIQEQGSERDNPNGTRTSHANRGTILRPNPTNRSSLCLRIGLWISKLPQ
jgi:sugar/nucleoside kinase (ribokinase family)